MNPFALAGIGMSSSRWHTPWSTPFSQAPWRASAWRVKKTPPGGPGGASGASAYSPFFLRLRDQIRLKPSPSSSSNRLAKIGALKLGSSSLSER